MQVEEDKVKAEKEKDEADQHGYDVGVAETEDVFRAEVPIVCHAYYIQTWEEALNRAGIEASSKLRKPENIVFPPALQISSQKEVAPPSSPSSQRGPTTASFLHWSARKGQRTRDLERTFLG